MILVQVVRCCQSIPELDAEDAEQEPVAKTEVEAKLIAEVPQSKTESLQFMSESKSQGRREKMSKNHEKICFELE